MNKHDKYLTHVPLYKATIKTATSTPRTKSASIQKVGPSIPPTRTCIADSQKWVTNEVSRNIIKGTTTTATNPTSTTKASLMCELTIVSQKDATPSEVPLKLPR
jgi:hypothetical protein